MKGPEIEIDLTKGTRESFIHAFGPTCAAWLVNRFRRTIARYGAFAIHVNRDDEIPPWCEIAIAFLRRRKGWTVVSAIRRVRVGETPPGTEFKVYRDKARRAPRPLVFVQGGDG